MQCGDAFNPPMPSGHTAPMVSMASATDARARAHITVGGGRTAQSIRASEASWLPALTVALALSLLAGCGGGTAEPDASLSASKARALASVDATESVHPPVTADMTLDWAEFKFPDLFSESLGLRFPLIDYLGVTYNARAYPGPEGWRYLGITLEGDVFGLGDFTGGTLQAFDTVSHWAPQVWADWCKLRPSDCAAGGSPFGSAATTPPAATALDEMGFSETGLPLTVALPDRTAVSLPELGAPFDLALEREAGADTDFASVIASRPGLQATGSVRGVYTLGVGATDGVKPQITIPASEAAGLNPDTLAVLRIGPAVVEGEMDFAHVSLLPLRRNAQGDFVFVDPITRDGLFPPAQAQGTSGRARILAARRTSVIDRYEWIGGARYQLVTFQTSLNWAREPQLVRMVPDATRAADGWRRPATEAELLSLARQPMCQIVLLVHGHNEEEEDGDALATAPAPWMQTYKRLVWDLLYQQALAKDWEDRPLYPTACTAFYEYIYPSYRPIYSPVSDLGGGLRETLGESLGRLVADEFKRSPQLAAALAGDMPLGVVVVGHSQGGLVARAGLRFMPEVFKRRVERLITWGTPHHGASLYSLRFAMLQGHDMVIDGYRLPLQTLVQYKVASQALDTPGTRDLRLEARYRDRIDLRSLFPHMDAAAQDSLAPLLYSANLTEFNTSIGTREIDPGPTYTFLTGTKLNSATLDLVDDTGAWWAQLRSRQALRFQSGASATEKGATLDRLLLRSGYRQSDGAVPVFSQQGAGLYGPTAEAMGDVDHEEFYGAEPPHRLPASLAKGRLTAEKTFQRARLDASDRACPSLAGLAQAQDGTSLRLSGSLAVPRLAKTPERIGALIQRIQVRAGSRDGPVQAAFGFQFDTQGRFSGSAAAASVASGTVVVVVELKDGSEVQAPMEIQAASDFEITRLFEQPWSVTENREGLLRATLANQSSGTNLQCQLTMTWTLPNAHDQPLRLSVLRREVADGLVRNENFFIRYLSYGGRVMPMGDGRYASRNGDFRPPASTMKRTDQGVEHQLSLLPTQRIEGGYYEKRPTLYLEIQGLCGGSETTTIRMDYRQR